MTLRADLVGLLAAAGLVDVDVDEAIADQHVRSAAYRRIVSAVAASQSRDGDRRIVATILRDPETLTSKTAVVALIDEIAGKAADPVSFRRWGAELLLEVDLLKADGHCAFIRQRVHDWLFSLSVEDGYVPEPAELAEVTDWMQRSLAGRSTSTPLLSLLAESGSTKRFGTLPRTEPKFAI